MSNINNNERILRVIIGIILIIIGFLISGVVASVLYLIALILIITGFMGMCPIYAVFKTSSAGAGLEKISKRDIEDAIKEYKTKSLLEEESIKEDLNSVKNEAVPREDIELKIDDSKPSKEKEKKEIQKTKKVTKVSKADHKSKKVVIKKEKPKSSSKTKKVVKKDSKKEESKKIVKKPTKKVVKKVKKTPNKTKK